MATSSSAASRDASADAHDGRTPQASSASHVADGGSIVRDHRCSTCHRCSTPSATSSQATPARRSEHDSMCMATSTDGRKGSKLRNSCQSCAASKIKCDKQKPVCGRCFSKGLPCQYVQSRRPGRVPGQRRAQPPTNSKSQRDSDGSHGLDLADVTNTTTSAATSVGSPSACSSTLSNDFAKEPSFSADGANDSMTSNASTTTPKNDAPRSGSSTAPCSDIIVNQSGAATTPNSSYNGLMDWHPDFAELDPWWTLDPIPSTEDCIMSADTTTSSKTTNSIADGLDEPTGASSMPPVSAPRGSAVPIIDTAPLASRSTTSQLSVQQHAARTRTNSFMPCNCVIQAIDLYKTICDGLCIDVMPPDGSHFPESAIVQNRHYIASMMALLQCSLCSDDSFLLTTLFMATLKTLARYASLAAMSIDSAVSIETDNPNDNLGNQGFEQGKGAKSATWSHVEKFKQMARAWGGVDMRIHTLRGPSSTHAQTNPREAVQPILRELYRAQKLVLALRKRCESPRNLEPGCITTSPGQTHSSPSVSRSDSVTGRTGLDISEFTGYTELSALSPRTLASMEYDVRMNLGALSAVMRDVLGNS